MVRAGPAPGGSVESVTAKVFEIPTDRPEADGTLSWTKTTVVVAEVSGAGEVGTGWTYGAAACASVIADPLAGVLKGTPVADVGLAYEKMVRACRNIGRVGVAACAISALDIALWDLKARLRSVPLSTLFGRATEGGVALYGSGGFTTYRDDELRRQLGGWVEEVGVRAVKIKIGEDRGTRVERDLERVAVARQTVGPSVALMVDANGAYRRKQAVRVGRQMGEEQGVTWFEEPVSSDDLPGLREVRDQIPLDVAAGEYGFDETYFARMVAADAVDCVQIDATRCGGYTSWLRIAGLAAASGLDVSAHCGPHLHAHVAVAVPNARHIEYFHDHVRVDPMLFDGLPTVRDGAVIPPETCGHGMVLKEPDAAAWRTG